MSIMPICNAISERPLELMLKNTGGEEIEIVTATGGTQAASDEIVFKLKDEDGNVLSTVPFKQTVGENFQTLSNGRTVARIAAGETWTSGLMEINIPASAPDKVYAVVEIGKVHYHLNRADHVEMQGVRSSCEAVLTDTTYFGEVLEITPNEVLNEATADNDGALPEVFIKGRAVSRETKEPLAGAALKLVIAVKGYERSYDLTCGDDGKFTQSFKPLVGECGTYQVYVLHPELKDRKIQGTFTVKRAVVKPAGFNIKIPRNYTQILGITLETGEGTELQNARVVFLPADQPLCVLPEGVKADCGVVKALVSGASSASFEIKLTANNKAPETISLYFTVEYTVKVNGVNELRRIPVKAQCIFTEARPALFFTPNYLETGLACEENVVEKVMLENRGLGEMVDVVMTLVNTDGTPAPSWVRLVSADYLDSLAVGKTFPVSIEFAPPKGLAEQVYAFKLRVESGNYPVTDINLFASVTQSGRGNALFKMQDIYTGTVDKEGNVVQGLAGATLKLQHDMVSTVQFTAVSDASGEAVFTDLPSGTYKVKATANNHQEWIGRLTVKPGMTAFQEVFLDYNLVTVSWEVVPVTIEDKYEIILNTTFETDVPAPVLVAEPGSITVPYMKKGDVFNTQFKITNHGLIKAKLLGMTGFPDNDLFDPEMPAPEGELGAGSVFEFPVTINTTRDVEECQSGVLCTTITYEFEAECGKKVRGQMPLCLRYQWGNCPENNKPGPIAPPVSQGGGMQELTSSIGGGGVSTKPSSGAAALESGVPCWVYSCWSEWWNKLKGVLKTLGCSLNMIMREFWDSETDLSVKVPGGFVELKRNYRGSNWQFDFLREPLYMFDEEFLTGAGAAYTLSRGIALPEYSELFNWGGCKKKGTTNVMLIRKSVPYYQYSEAGKYVYRHGEYEIRYQADRKVWQWKGADGEWEEYDSHGRFISFGNRIGLLGELIYRAPDPANPPYLGKSMTWGGNDNPSDYDFSSDQTAVLGVKDRTGRQVLWFDYETVDNQLVSVTDVAGRKVEYGYITKPDMQGYIMIPETEHKMFASMMIFNPYHKKRPLISFKNQEGNEIRYKYDKVKGTITKTMPGGQESVFYKDKQGHIVKYRDDIGEGYDFTYDYNSTTKISYTGMRHTSGRLEEVWYDKCGDPVLVKENGRTTYKLKKVDGSSYLSMDENGYVTEVETDQWKKSVHVVLHDGREISTEYDPVFHLPVKVTDENGLVTLMEYDGVGNMIRKVNAAGTGDEQEVRAEYNDMGQAVSMTQGRGAETSVMTFSYDGLGNLEVVRDPMGSVTRFKNYDAYGNFHEMENAVGKKTFFEYDTLGRITSKTDPSGRVTQFEYNGMNNMTGVTNALGKKFELGYDGYHNVINVKDLLGGEVRKKYNSDHLPVEVTDQEGAVVSQSFDNEGRIQTKTDASGNTVRYYYDDSGETHAPRGTPVKVETAYNSTEYVFDNYGRVVRENMKGGEKVLSTEYFYNEKDQLASVRDAEGKTVSYEYDNLGRVVKVIDPAGYTTETTYDSRGNAVVLKDAEGREWKYEYDLANRPVRMIKPLGQVTMYEYNALSQLERVLDSKGQKIEYEYTDTGRIAKTKYFESKVDAYPIKTVEFSYNEVGNLTGYSDGVTSAVYTYDDLQRKTGETVNYGSFSLSYEYEYLKNGLRKSFTGPDGVKTEYVYDSGNKLSGVKIPGAGDVSVNGYQMNSPLGITLPGGSRREFSYDPFLRLKTLRSLDPAGNALMNQSFTYSDGGNLLEKSTEHGNYNYTYDALSRLKGAENPQNGIEAYTFDKVGNRLSAVGTGAWQYNANNELKLIDGHSFEYDSNGNLTRKVWNGSAQTFYYDIENRLADVEDDHGNAIAKYYYDPFGRRLWKETGGVRTNFFYSDEGLVAETNAAGEITKSYGYYPRSSWSTNPLYLKQNGQYYFYHTDAQGTPCKLTETNGHVVWEATYNSFGNVHILTDEVKNPWRFAGQYADEETGLYYNWNRYYDPIIGRYTQTDPEGEGLNLYAYCFNNPTRFIDPQGTHALANAYDSLMNALDCPWLEGFIEGAFFGGLGYAAGLMQSVLGETITQAIFGGLYGNGSFMWGKGVGNIVGNIEMVLGLAEAAYSAGRWALGAATRGFSGKGEIIQRAMSRAELQATKETGLLRGGRDGTHYASNNVNSDALRARQRLGLPQTPEVRVTIEVPANRFSPPSKVDPAYNMPGGGMERTATGRIPARIIRVDEY